MSSMNFPFYLSKQSLLSTWGGGGGGEGSRFAVFDTKENRYVPQNWIWNGPNQKEAIGTFKTRELGKRGEKQRIF